MVAVGVTVIAVPLPIELPPQEVEYHTHEALVPKVPPTRDNAEEAPVQTVVGFADAEVAATETEFIDTVALTQMVVLHDPSALT